MVSSLSSQLLPSASQLTLSTRLQMRWTIEQSTQEGKIMVSFPLPSLPHSLAAHTLAHLPDDMTEEQHGQLLLCTLYKGRERG